MRKYPLPLQYQQALQNPRLSLFDDELKHGAVQTDKLGLPRVRSGNFASVYKIFTANAQYAIKCFLNAPDDMQTRCEQISNYLNKIDCGYFLKFQYIARGISVNAQAYPILKMPWQDGIPLDRYIDICAAKKDTQGILSVRGRFLEMYKTLRGHRIAHGDLQHGNILINQEGGLRLIDYDGLYCPEMTLNTSCESGHPNYQHPKRKTCHYDEHIDSFSAVVIFTALTALAHDLSLWQKYYNGDNLLFCARDFLNTNQSLLFRTLSAAPVEQIKTLTEAIAASCLTPYEQLPDFLGQLDAISAEAGDLELPLSMNSWTTEREDMPGQLPGQLIVKPSAGTRIHSFPTGSTAVAADLTNQEPPHYGHTMNIKVVCPNCSAINDQSTALCLFCGYILSIPIPPEPKHQPQRQFPPEPAAAQTITFGAKLKLSLLYFILFSLILAAYDQTDNNRAILNKAITYLKAGKNKLLGRIKNDSGETAEYPNRITASPSDTPAYRSGAYMKAGHVTEAADDPARLAINKAAAGDNRSTRGR
ncbi:protein kinase domain-containing protein [Candidatus Magnetominusculus xianensis]|uniref:Protein kinase domain-containing protein n=1 Tax=Candidatus Magnetominusculus xianensis TaxID=1748249 RepID=A0ABR5SIV6_9BACT|nr:protein kinase family protein [Candidatus Magnetominusculus xianensis]KWT92911.1 hypothetical protein ASN18_0346 [Candidatus Magnetominusculus xianensis]MBF0402915.1 protein kinase family protein [Nitrospirota bacterium]